MLLRPLVTPFTVPLTVLLSPLVTPDEPFDTPPRIDPVLFVGSDPVVPPAVVPPPEPPEPLPRRLAEPLEPEPEVPDADVAFDEPGGTGVPSGESSGSAMAALDTGDGEDGPENACGAMIAAATAAPVTATPATALRRPPPVAPLLVECTLAALCAARKTVRLMRAPVATRNPANASFDSETTANSRLRAWRARQSSVSIVPISTPSWSAICWYVQPEPSRMASTWRWRVDRRSSARFTSSPSTAARTRSSDVSLPTTPTGVCAVSSMSSVGVLRERRRSMSVQMLPAMTVSHG